MGAGATTCLPAATMANPAMIDQKTGVLFKTSNATLQRIFDEAEAKARWNIANFGKYRVLVEGAGYDNVWLETQPMGGYMYAKRNLETARNNIQIFIDFQNKEGRFPGMISYVNGRLVPHYGWFQGYCFPMPACELYYWLDKDKKYLERLYRALARFDDYLWKTRDSDHDGCLESWCVCDTGEDHGVRFNGCQWAWPFDVPPTMENIYKTPEDELKKCGISKNDTARIAAFPTPLESMDMMSYSYTGRDVLAHIAKLFAVMG